MRPIDANTLAALTGSRAGDRLVIWPWYNGNPTTTAPLKVSQCTMDWDYTRQIQTLTLTIADPDGSLSPWLLEDALGVGGAELQVIYQVGGAGAVNMGWYRIDKVTPAENWTPYIIDNLGQVNPGTVIPKDKRLVFTSGGSSIQITASDRGLDIQNGRLLAPDSPQGTSPTIMGEISRLLDGIAPVTTYGTVTDRAVNKTLIYVQERLNAVQDLCKRISCDYRMNGDGQFEVYPVAKDTPVWTIAGGPEGVLVQVNRAQDITGLYNVFVADGTITISNQQVPIRGIASIVNGPLAVTGPHGSYPLFYSSTMLTTQAQCDAYAITMRDTQIAGLTVDLAVTCLPNPALQQGDWVVVAAPVINNQIVRLIGRVKTMQLNAANGTVGAMALTVECSYSDVQLVMGGVDRG